MVHIILMTWRRKLLRWFVWARVRAHSLLLRQSTSVVLLLCANCQVRRPWCMLVRVNLHSSETSGDLFHVPREIWVELLLSYEGYSGLPLRHPRFWFGAINSYQGIIDQQSSAGVAILSSQNTQQP
ncbi:hypothetical protein R1flu_015352 [Riccia fluitans]|uniref:Secreted protein n=1 Tax=Riccia fluitans TaxID=41844 RepID=A0ABD1YJ66_9MARC